MTGDLYALVYEGSCLTVTYDASEPGGEVSLHSEEYEQERMVLSLDGWRELTEAVQAIAPVGIETVARETQRQREAGEPS